ncbi:MAG TPA: TatD family hydrolase [Anaerolineae bacterium]|nr:TatD family hydrolase [Anaerolineae bacterium]
MLIDTHAHLDFHQFDRDRDAVLQRARQAGVGAIITIGTDVTTSRAAVELAARYEGVFATVGMHPHDAQALDGDALATLRELGRRPKVVAIGEIGLDFYRDRSPRDVQRRAFRAQLAWAAALGKPVVVHDRDAHDDVMSILIDWAAGLSTTSLAGRAGVLHTFSGDLSMAQRALAAGFYISVSGPVTYKNARHLPDVVRAVPLDRLLVETDCPFLAPEPHRGQRNEPAYVSFVAGRVADLKGVPVDHVARATTENARRLFQLPEAGTLHLEVEKT